MDSSFGSKLNCDQFENCSWNNKLISSLKPININNTLEKTNDVDKASFSKQISFSDLFWLVILSVNFWIVWEFFLKRYTKTGKQSKIIIRHNILVIKEKYVYYEANGQSFREYEGEDSYIFTEVLLNSEWWFVWKEKILIVEGKKICY